MAYKIIHKYVLLFDSIAVTGSLAAAYWLRALVSPIQPPHFYLSLLCGAIGLYLIAAALFRLYNGNRPLLALSYFVDFLKALFMWLGLVIGFAYITKADYSRAVVLAFFAFSFITLYTIRVLAVYFSSIHNGTHDKHEIDDAAAHIKKKVTKNGSSNIPVSSTSRSYHTLKRTIDICVACGGLTAIAPAYPIIALLIKRESNGPVIISQERVGQNGQSFTLYKLRTMHDNVALYKEAPSSPEDRRITHIGRILRKTSADELPQLINVLRGDMSIVGPRPEMPFLVHRYEDWQHLRHQTKPGLTGVWQIYGRKDRPLHENVEYDIYYVQNRSLFLDLAIILKTISHLILPKGAY